MRYLVLYNVKPDISDWATERFDFDLKKCDFSKAPRFIQDDGDDVIDAKWLIKKCDTAKYDGLIAYVDGNVLKGVWGTHVKNQLGDKRFSVIQCEHHERTYREPKGILGNIKMVSTRKKTPYPQAQYTFDHELVHSYKYLKGEKDYLHLAIKFGNYDGYINGIPKKKVYPLKDWNKISQPFGVVNWKLYPKTGKHWGVDHAVPSRTPIFAPRDGFLRDADSEYVIPDLGTYCLFSFKSGFRYYTLLFAHLSKTKEYGKYKKGDIIGYTGNTGKSTAPHCHTELWKGLIVDRDEITKKTIDPIKYFPVE